MLDNAVKYGDAGSEIEIEAVKMTNYAGIAVRNQGAAIDVEEYHHLFKRFYRGKGSGMTEGSGLGLAIAKSFTELHYGTLEVTTEADLFKVNIRLPKRTEEFSTRNQQKNDGKSTK